MLSWNAAGGKEGSGLAGELNGPWGIAIKPDGGLYVADTFNHRILFFEEGSTEGRLVAGGKIGSGLAGELNRPFSIAIKPDGGLYVADAGNNRILFFEEGSTEGRLVAGGKQGSGLAGELDCPSGIAIKPGGGLYVADTDNHRILFFEEGSTEGRLVAGGKLGSSLAGELDYPSGIAIKPGGGLYVADTDNHRILFFEEGSTEGRLVAGGKEGSGLAGELTRPFGIAIKPGGGLYVADTKNHRILFFEEGSTEGRLVAGGKNGSGLAGELKTPFGIAIKPGGGLYVADTDNHRILYSLPPGDVDRFVESSFLSQDIVAIVHVCAGSQADYINGIASKSYVRELPILAQRQVLEKALGGDARGVLSSMALLWGFSQTEQLLESLADDQFTEENSRSMLASHLLDAKATKYGGLAIAKDSVLPSVDYALDNVSLVTYALLEQYDFLAIVTVGILFNVCASSLAMMTSEGRYGKASLVCHVLTLGLYGFVAEARHCNATGKKTELLVWMKNFELVESMFSFMVGTYTILISGYLPGFKQLVGSTLILRYLSVTSSLLTLPLGAFDFSNRELARAFFFLRQEGKQVSDYVRSHRNWSACLALGMFHATEVQFMLSFLILQLATRPYGIFIALAIYCVAMVAPFFYVAGASHLSVMIIAAIIFTPLFMIFNPVVQALRELEVGASFERIIAIMRFIAILSAWVSMFTIWALGGIDEHIISQLTNVTCLPLVCIAVFGSILHPVMILQQWCAGRFEPFERTESAHPEAYQRIAPEP